MARWLRQILAFFIGTQEMLNGLQREGWRSCSKHCASDVEVLFSISGMLAGMSKIDFRGWTVLARR